MSSDDAVGQLVGLGIAADRARLLVDDHGHNRVRSVVAAAYSQGVRNPAGWVIQALVDGWQLSSDGPEDRERVRRRAARRADQTRRHLDEVRDGAEGQSRATGWATVLDGALDDGQLREAIDAVAARLPSTVQRSVPIVRAHLLALAARAHRSCPQEPAQVALRRHLREPGIALVAADRHGLTPPPTDHPPGDPARFTSRIAAALAQRTSSCSPPRHTPTALERTNDDPHPRTDSGLPRADRHR